MAINNALNLSGTGVVTADGDGTWTYSTLTEGGVVLAGASNSLTDTGVLAKGTILVGDGVTAPTELAVGADTEVLTADSAEASGVKWAAVSGGGVLTLLDSATASGSATLDFTTSIDSTYNTYLFVWNGIHPGTNATDFVIQTSSDAGVSWDATANMYHTEYSQNGAASTTSLTLEYITAYKNIYTDDTSYTDGYMFLFNPSAARYTLMQGMSVYMRNSSNAVVRHMFSGAREAEEDVNGVRFKMLSGNIDLGSIYLYGMTQTT